MSLKKVVGKTRLSYDESVTVISEIKNSVNSRLLTYLTEENYQTTLSPAICKPRHWNLGIGIAIGIGIGTDTTNAIISTSIRPMDTKPSRVVT